jgi:hypothetical protein
VKKTLFPPKTLKAQTFGGYQLNPPKGFIISQDLSWLPFHLLLNVSLFTLLSFSFSFDLLLFFFFFFSFDLLDSCFWFVL